MTGRFASAGAAKLAADLGLEDVEVAGTGRGGKVTISDVRKAAPPGPPEGLGEAGQGLWQAVTADLVLRADELALLGAACRLQDEIGAMEAALAGAEPMTAGSRGQPVANPLLAEVRAHRLALRQLLAALDIPEAEDGEGGDEGSVAGRKLARARWDRRHG